MKAKELFGEAKWVSPSRRVDGPYIRGEFPVSKEVKKAEITICGLGWFALYLNGRKVTDELFTPANSDYHACEGVYCSEKFGEVLSHRIYCMQYDITDYLKQQNCIGVALAGGWYQMETDGRYGQEYSYGCIKLCYRMVIHYADGSEEELLSDGKLKWTQSPMVYHSLRKGEHYDYDTYRLEGWNEAGYEDAAWEATVEAEAPDTEYYIQNCPSDRVIRHLKPTLVAETENGYVYDMGENITGTPVIRATGPAGSKIVLRCSERLNPDQTIEEYTMHMQESSFVTDGSDRLYRLQFTWYGFRYAEVSRNAQIVDCEVIHTDIAVSSGFQSDSKVLNWLYEAYLRTQLDNIHCSIPSDCPHLERQGYTGDGQLTAECCMMLLDSRRMYEKWLQDIADCQDTVSGHVQYCAPYVHCGGGPGGWGCAIIEVPWQFYRIFGDQSVLEEFLPKALHYFEYLEAHSEEGLVISDQPGLWCLGDWCTPEAIQIPQPFVNTYFYIKSLNRAIEAARIIGREELIEGLATVREEKCRVLISHYFDEKSGDFAGNIQGANAFAVDLGLGDERTLTNMVARYRDYGMYDTGIFGTDIVTRVLFEKGYDQEAFDLLTSEGKYSFYNWMVSGATTLPEYWTFKRSQNHPMFGAVVKYLFTYLLGIVNEDVAYRKVRIEPRFVEGLNQAEGYLITAAGRIGVAYHREDNKVTVQVEIPEDVSAVLAFRGEEIPLHTGSNEIIRRL